MRNTLIWLCHRCGNITPRHIETIDRVVCKCGEKMFARDLIADEEEIKIASALRPSCFDTLSSAQAAKKAVGEYLREHYE